MHLDHAWIERHIPHQGSMCLLEGVVRWDGEGIVCLATSHRRADNPLVAQGRLGIACGIEYAAQAMAVHGALLAGADTSHNSAPATIAAGPPADQPSTTVRAGFLAGVRNVRAFVLRLDDLTDDLICSATRIAGDGGSALYEFDLHAGVTRLMLGRATVMLDASDRLRA